MLYKRHYIYVHRMKIKPVWKNKSMMTMLYQIENINKDIEIIFKNWVEIPYLKSTEMKTNSLEELNSRLELSKQRIIKFIDQ